MTKRVTASQFLAGLRGAGACDEAVAWFRGRMRRRREGPVPTLRRVRAEVLRDLARLAPEEFVPLGPWPGPARGPRGGALGPGPPSRWARWLLMHAAGRPWVTGYLPRAGDLRPAVEAADAGALARVVASWGRES